MSGRPLLVASDRNGTDQMKPREDFLAYERRLGEGGVGMEDCATGLSDALSQDSRAYRGLSISCLSVSLPVGFIIPYRTPVSSTWWEIQLLVLPDSHSPTVTSIAKRPFSLS